MYIAYIYIYIAYIYIYINGILKNFATFHWLKFPSKITAPANATPIVVTVATSH